MVGHASLFSQMLSLVDRHRFERLVREHKAERGAKGFSWSQFVAMMFCQLAQAKSLREIIDGLACCEGKIRHLGLEASPKRSTLSYANGRRPWQLFEALFYSILEVARALAPGKRLRFKNKLFSLDATGVELCLEMFDWARYRQTNGGHQVACAAGSRWLSTGLRARDRRQRAGNRNRARLESAKGQHRGDGPRLY